MVNDYKLKFMMSDGYYELEIIIININIKAFYNDN